MIVCPNCLNHNVDTLVWKHVLEEQLDELFPTRESDVVICLVCNTHFRPIEQEEPS